MTLGELERLIASQAPGALVPRDWVLDLVRAVEPAAVGETALGDLDVEEAGRALHRSPSTVRDYCRSNRLPGAYRQRGREWRIPREAIRAFQRAEAAPPTTVRHEDADSINLGAWREEIERDRARRSS